MPRLIVLAVDRRELGRPVRALGYDPQSSRWMLTEERREARQFVSEREALAGLAGAIRQPGRSRKGKKVPPISGGGLLYLLDTWEDYGPASARVIHHDGGVSC